MLRVRFESKLKCVLGKAHPIGILIKGKWGVGKTYFWKEFTNKKENYDKCKFLYVSLANKKTIVDVQEDIVSQLEDIYHNL